MTDPITSSRAIAAEEAFQVTERALRALFPVASLSDDQLATPEWGKAEYLLNCAADGAPTLARPGVENLAAQLGTPGLPWVVVEDNKVLVLRWLAHLIGFRHRAIHLFLDHPHHPDCTFVQIRSLSKYNSPGLFDMAVGGHVEGLDSREDSVQRELQEELGLNADHDLNSLFEIGTYNIEIKDFQPNYQEVEHTTVYRATIEPEAFGRIQFQESEVGGLVLFKRSELEKWMDRSPERFGGGLLDSWPHYGPAGDLSDSETG
jgi:8-oxo-dGTP pyrophosphatase MutT (NUDIX family)